MHRQSQASGQTNRQVDRKTEAIKWRRHTYSGRSRDENAKRQSRRHISPSRYLKSIVLKTLAMLPKLMEVEALRATKVYGIMGRRWKMRSREREGEDKECEGEEGGGG